MPIYVHVRISSACINYTIMQYIPNFYVCTHLIIVFFELGLYTDYITGEDIEVVCVQLEAAWPVLGQALGFSRTELERIAMVSKTHLSAAQSMMQEWKTLYKQNATFFALLGALEIIQRRDIADDVVASRMRGVGINL